MWNLKLAFRSLFKSPFVTVVAILSLALGLGANTALYSLFRAVLLQPLPAVQPDRLVNFAAAGPVGAGASCNEAGPCDAVFSYPMFRNLAAANTAFSGIAGHVLFDASVAVSGSTPISGEGACVSGSYFPVLGLRAAAGRLLTAGDDQHIGRDFVAVLSYQYWESQLGSNPAVVGSLVTINGQSMTIVGVASKGFSGTTLGAQPTVFVPITMRAAMSGGANGFYDQQAQWIYLFGRLKAGATIEQARARLDAKHIVLTAGAQGQSVTRTESRTSLTLLLSIAAIVLMIACVNIANLLLARAANRASEMAVRVSLGASRRQLVAQVLTESVVLASLAGVVSVIVAYWTLAAVATLLPAQLSSIQVGLNAPAFALTAALSLATGVLFGAAPAVQVTRSDVVTPLRSTSRSLSSGRHTARLRGGLVTAQVAMSMTLLIAAGLFIKSLRNLANVDLAIEMDHVVAFAISPTRTGYDVPRAWALYDRLRATLSALPGVNGVTQSVVPVLAGSNWGRSVSVEGFTKGPDTDAGARFNAVGPGYLHVLGVRLLAGRDFTAADNATSTKVAIVNEAFARKFNLGANAVGKRMSAGNDSLDVTIVGVARSWTYSTVKEDAPPVFVRPYTQAGGRSPTMTFYVRTEGAPEAMLRAIPAVMKTLDPTLPVEGLTTLPRQFEQNIYIDRMISSLSAAFAIVATLLAAIGLYGTLAYSVARRTREIGVRMALGASRVNVGQMVLRQVARMTLIGGLIGIAGAIALGHAARSLLFQLEGTDPAVILLAAVSLTAVAFAAGFIPAMKASRIEPMTALRHE